MDVDKMMVYANTKGNGELMVSNRSRSIEYVKLNISKIDCEGVESSKQCRQTEFSKDNLLMWDLSVEPNKFILHPGEEKHINIRNLKNNLSNVKSDRVYKITILPDRDRQKGQNFSVNYGYAPYFIIPANNQNVKYKFKKLSKNKVHVENLGNTYFKININNCGKNHTVEQKCNYTGHLVPGRKRDLTIPFDIDASTSIKILNYDESIKYEVN